MDLKERQRPLKERYRENPEASKITLTASASQDDQVACSVDLGRLVQEAQAHEGVGGPGSGPCSGDLLLGALAACAQLTSQMVAAATGIEGDVSVEVEGDLDLSGTLGVDREAKVGFEEIRLRFKIDAPGADPDDIEAWQRKSERYCTVLQTLQDPPRIETEMVSA
jgi:uncharacterized OsmC-like protein